MAKQPEVRYINYYVSGNIACKPEYVRTKKANTQLPTMPKQKKQLHTVDMNAVCCVVLSVVLLLALTVSAVQFLRAKEETAQVQRYVQSLQQENEMLTKTYVESFDEEQIRMVAENLGMIPAEQAAHITMQVQLPAMEQQPTVWETVMEFLKGLFA